MQVASPVTLRGFESTRHIEHEHHFSDKTPQHPPHNRDETDTLISR